MTLDALPTLLKNAISRELRTQLTTVSPPSREIHEYAVFPQDLENKRRYFDNVAIPATRTFSAVAKAGSSTPPPPSITSRTPAAPANDAIDLSSQRRPQQFTPNANRSGRKERGECFRCGEKGHLVRDCPHPDRRPVQFRSQNERSPSPASVQGSVSSPARGRASARDSLSPPKLSDSAKGVSLNRVASRLDKRA